MNTDTDLPTFTRQEPADTRQNGTAAAWATLAFILAVVAAGSCLIGFVLGMSAP